MAHLLANLGWVDFDLGILSGWWLLLPKQAGWWNIQNQSQPKPGSPGDRPPCGINKILLTSGEKRYTKVYLFVFLLTHRSKYSSQIWEKLKIHWESHLYWIIIYAWSFTLTFFLSLIDPFPLTMILHPVSCSNCFVVMPRGPKMRPTKLNWIIRKKYKEILIVNIYTYDYLHLDTLL